MFLTHLFGKLLSYIYNLPLAGAVPKLMCCVSLLGSENLLLEPWAGDSGVSGTGRCCDIFLCSAFDVRRVLLKPR
jgi:hypothetical protein